MGEKSRDSWQEQGYISLREKISTALMLLFLLFGACYYCY